MKISVIVVSYNTKELLKDCLESLFAKNRNVEKETIVVDNASNDKSCEMIKKNFPEVILMGNKKNVGFAAGNNRGLKKARGDYILLLNPDTRFLENSLEKMVHFMEANLDVGIASCQLVNEAGEIQASGGFFPNLGRVFAWMFFLDDLPFVSDWIKPFHPHDPKFYTGSSWYTQEHLQDWVTGAFFLIRREVFQDVGELDEHFFMYVEEMEYCFRARKKGWKVTYTPLTKIIHLGGQSGSLKNALLSEYQGLKYFFAKHKPIWQSWALRIFLKIGALLRILFFGIIKGNRQLGETYVEAFRIA